MNFSQTACDWSNAEFVLLLIGLYRAVIYVRQPLSGVEQYNHTSPCHARITAQLSVKCVSV